MDNEQFIELLRMIKDVNGIADKNIKQDKIHQISAYGAYLYYTGVISNTDFTDAIKCINCDYEDDLYYEERNNYIDMLLDNNALLNTFFRKSLITYWHYKINEKDDNIDIDIENEFNSFLKYMKCYRLYKDVQNKGQISTRSKILKHSVCLDNRNDSYVIIKAQNKFHEYLELSHEMAHVLENKLLSKYKRSFDSPYNVEILSITFNRIFIEYLYQNNKINKEEYTILLNNFEVNYFNFIRLALFISDSINSGYYDINDYDISIYCEEDIVNRSLTDYNYAIGRIAAFKLFNDYLKSDTIFINSIPKLVDNIYHMDISEIIKTFGNKETIINKELSKTFIKK